MQLAQIKVALQNLTKTCSAVCCFVEKERETLSYNNSCILASIKMVDMKSVLSSNCLEKPLV